MQIHARYTHQTIWIIGATTGIGRALAEQLAREGATLALSARNASALTELAQQLGPHHTSHPLDVADSSAVSAAAQAIWDTHPQVDRVLFMAAAYTPMRLTQMDLAVATQMVTTNLTGALNLLHAALPKLIAQPHGQIALCSSVAAYTGLPGGQPYSATKAGITNLTESLYGELPCHINVKLISPGFVHTPLTAKNNFEMPAIITPESAARAIADGLLKTNFEIHFPKRFTLMLKLLQHLPYRLRLTLARKTDSTTKK